MRAHGLLLVIGVTILTWSCGGSKDTPTTPSAAVVAPVAASPQAAAQPASAGALELGDRPAVAFPPRNESLMFRQRLEAKYREQMGRPAIETYVDLEGDIVWTQEYLRYRVNRCSHMEALNRVMSQIDGGGVPPACGEAPPGVTEFPPRNEPYDFRQRLEAKYRDDLGRGTVQTHVDLEGDIVWTQEYLRYRANWCGHLDSVEKVFTQIDGGGTPPV